MTEKYVSQVASGESVSKHRIFERFAGAVGVLGSILKGRHSGQSLADSSEELRLAGIPASEIASGIEDELLQAAAEHGRQDASVAVEYSAMPEECNADSSFNRVRPQLQQEIKSFPFKDIGKFS